MQDTNKLSNYPKFINVEIMDICNLKCSHCYIENWDNHDGFMDYNLFEKLIERLSEMLKHAQSFDCSSVEGLFHKSIFDMFDLVKKINPDIFLHVNTNGTLFTDEKIYKLLEREIYDISWSLDGYTKETVESFKNGVNFETIIDSIKRVRELGKGKFRIHTLFVSHKNNIHELLDYVDFCRDLGVMEIKISGLFAHNPIMSKNILWSKEGMPEVDEIYETARKKAESYGIMFRYPETKLNPVGCFVYETMFVGINGDVHPCIYFSKDIPFYLLDEVTVSKTHTWGNLLDKNPYDIWNSTESVNFRNMLYNKKLPEECKLCNIGMDVICSPNLKPFMEL
jgi:MoaA/NifB/PqqE/SkfB family radical SAM enzyme